MGIMAPKIFHSVRCITIITSYNAYNIYQNKRRIIDFKNIHIDNQRVMKVNSIYGTLTFPYIGSFYFRMPDFLQSMTV